MKKRIFSRAFALFMALSLLGTTALAADFIAEVMLEGQTRDQITDEQRYTDFQTALDNSGYAGTVFLLDDVDITVDSTVNPNGEPYPVCGITAKQEETTIDFDGHTLTVHSSSTGTVAGIYNGNSGIRVQNGELVIDAQNSETVFAVAAPQNYIILDSVEINSREGTTLTAAVTVGRYGAAMLTDCVILEGSVDNKSLDDYDQGGYILVNSGVYGELDSSVEIAEGSEDKADDFFPSTSVGSTPKPKVIVSADTAAVVIGEDGSASTYSDLNKAVKASNGAKVVVTDENALKNLEVKEGDKLNLVDAAGESLNDKVTLGADLVLGENGVVSAKPAEPVVDPGTGAVEPATPVTPVIPDNVTITDTDMPLANGTDTTVISDNEVPLAGLITRAQLVSYLYEHEGSPDGADAEGEYTLAMAWAVANGIVDEEDAPEEIVTVAILKDVMTNYAAYLDAAFDVVIEGEDDMVVMNCDEILAEFYASVEAEAA